MKKERRIACCRVENVKKRANSMSASILQLLLEGLPACRDLLLLPVVASRKRKKRASPSFPGLEVVIVPTPTTGPVLSRALEQGELIEISSSCSDESYHTAELPQDESLELSGGGGQLLQIMRLQRAVEERTGRVKGEDPAGDFSHLAQIPAFTGRFLRPPISRSNGEGPPVHLSQEMADRLVLSYLSREYANLPILDLQDFRSAYEITRSEKDIAAGTSSFHGILHTIFGLSGLSTSDLNDTDVASLFNHGQKISKDTENGGPLCERIQSHILQSQYLYATGNPKLAWMFIGFAIRMTLVLDLQFKKGGRDSRGRRDRELARRLWHSAMILERIIALQIGLPPQTSNPLKVPLPTHMDMDYTDLISGGDPAPGIERPSLIEFLTACARLYSHVEDILAWEDELRMQPYSCSAKNLLAFDFKIFLKVDTLLYDWQSSLPSFLREDAAGGLWDDSVVCRQRNVLRARYLYVRLRLYRPLLILGLALSTKCSCRPRGRPHATKEDCSSPNFPVVFSAVRDASIKSVGIAMGLVNLIQAYEDGPLNGSPDDGRRSLISPYWENIDYIYACGTVFLAARLSNFTRPHADDAGTVSEEEVETYLTQSIDMLDNYKHMRPKGRVARLAQLCCNTLRDLSYTMKGADSAAASTGATATLDETTRSRLLERMEKDNPTLNRSRRRSVENMCGYYGWIESLPIDLAGPLE
ncbi:hypothetical protein ETB97_007567 [Aspergillus alliaceus]|uniref:Xylanolytic transcriptional activator regulatory domain-containing protein n=1 Tax=Petromyces alliaceus TaxID=209559 RepID=A0A8H6AEK4_PETAA|nr:hypothetical protein ETB97_007567 [Aspergillus burnettii]